jgi:nucleobase:cation symporter-1, NCS1 family
MAVTDRVERALARETPEWGIHPVPDELRRFGGWDLAVLWGDLSIGLLVLVSGALLVPALGLPSAVLAIVTGTVIGVVPLGLVAAAGACERVPAMVLFRPVLGLAGSYLPSFANLIQLVGWTAFEFWAMGRVANAVSIDLFGWDAPFVWVLLVAIACTALALAGPIFTVRRWLERFGVWIVAAVALWITLKVVQAAALGTLWSRPGEGGLPFWLAVDLVIAMPISWLPLVADYTRFARDPRRAFAGTAAGYAVGNIWFYLLGALLVLAAGSGADVLDIGTSIAATAGGAVVLIALLVGESDNAMANVYSAAVTVQNARPVWPQRRLIVAVGVAGLAIATAIGSDAATALESFLFLIGSVFVPLFAVFLVDWGIRARGRFGVAAVFDRALPGIRWRAVVPWVTGFVVSQWCAPTTLVGWWTDGFEHVLHGWLRLPFPMVGDAALGGSIPGFVAAFVVALAVLPARAAAPPRDG